MVDLTKQFRIGQKVKLNSGSPELSVLETGDRTKVEWYDGLEMQTHIFHKDCLTAL